MDKIIEVQQDLNRVTEDEWKRLKKEKDELKKEKEEWETLALKLNKTQLAGKRIKLDVGGKVFATSLSTLTSQKGSYFEAMFSGRWEPKPEDDGCYFIDRDPTVFKHVLNYLRGEPPSLDMLSTQKLQQLKKDAEFYQLPGLSDYLDSLSGRAPSPTVPAKYNFATGPNYTVSSDGLQITKTSRQSLYDMTAITNPIPSSGVHHLKFQIVNTGGHILFGVCPSSINQLQLSNYEHCGWYFYCYNGTLFSGPPQSASSKSYYLTSAIRTGREVGVRMDMTNGQISFTVDEVDRGVAYTDIPVNQSLCFVVLLYNKNDTVRIVE